MHCSTNSHSKKPKEFRAPWRMDIKVLPMKTSVPFSSRPHFHPLNRDVCWAAQTVNAEYKLNLLNDTVMNLNETNKNASLCSPLTNGRKQNSSPSCSGLMVHTKNASLPSPLTTGGNNTSPTHAQLSWSQRWQPYTWITTRCEPPHMKTLPPLWKRRVFEPSEKTEIRS